MKRIITILAMLLLCGVLWAEGPDLEGILAEIDELGNFEEYDFSCIYNIISEKPGEKASSTEAIMFRRDREDLFMMIIRNPVVNRGEGYFQSDDNVWFYDPQSRKFEHSSLSENISGSDAKNSDMSQGTLSEDYIIEDWEENQIGVHPVYILSLKARTDDVSYDRMKIWVRRDKTIVLKSEEYGFSGNLMRTTLYLDYKEYSAEKYPRLSKNRYLPSRILMVDAINVGEKTLMTLGSPSLRDIPDHVFSKNYLESVNQ